MEENTQGNELNERPIAKNENPRANENLKGSEATSFNSEEASTEDVGSEITDGEDG